MTPYLLSQIYKQYNNRKTKPVLIDNAPDWIISRGRAQPEATKMVTYLSRFTLTIIGLLIIIQSTPSTSSPNNSVQLLLLSTTHIHIHSVIDFGAKGDGIHYDTAAIQSAIDACPPGNKPCEVRFPPGEYLTATIRLKSHVTLNIHEDATLLGGPRIEDYPEESSRWYVVLAENATDVGITGGGVVDGQAMKFVVTKNEIKNVMVSWNHTGACSGDECRPRLVGFLGCRNVNVWNVRLREPAYWWCVFYFSSSSSFLFQFCFS